MKSQYILKNLRRRWNTYGSWLNGECLQCGERKLLFYDKYDTVCCVGCDVWFSPKCDTTDCPFCSSRPDTPSEALFREEPQNGMVKEWNRINYQHKTNGQLRHEHRRDIYAQITENREQR